jgi:uncharacterized protein (DUF1501 family)
MKPDTSPSRRAFLKRASALSLVGTAAPWALNLAAMTNASAAGASDYKAMVCIFLNGGNDYANTVVPYDAPSYNTYQAMRPTFAHARGNLAATLLTPATAPLDATGAPHQYALAPMLAPLMPLFDSGKLGVLMNVGTLVSPTTKTSGPAKPQSFRPNCFRTTISNRPGNRRRLRERLAAGAGASGTSSKRATPTPSSLA